MAGKTAKSKASKAAKAAASVDPNKRITGVGVKFTGDEICQLDYLCSVFETNRSTLIRSLVKQMAKAGHVQAGDFHATFPPFKQPK